MPFPVSHRSVIGTGPLSAERSEAFEEQPPLIEVQYCEAEGAHAREAVSESAPAPVTDAEHGVRGEPV